jgi:hypothetical protein
MKWKLTLGLAIAASLAAAPEASAQAYSGPVASNAYITFNGLDWAWASPCASVDPSCGQINLSGGGGGWRFATGSEWAARPAASDFLSPGGNYATWSGHGNMACASGWFSLSYTHCDYTDAANNGWLMSGPGMYASPAAADQNGYGYYNETWLVRDVTASPEPASIALMATGILGVGIVMRRRRQNVA